MSSDSINYDCFILKLSINGNFEWVQTFEGRGITSLRISNDGYIYASGNFSREMNFTSPNINNPIVPVGLNDGFILKVSPLGNFIWVKQIGGTGNEGIYNLEFDSENNLIFSGSYNGVADLNLNPTIDTNIFSVYNYDCFIEKTDSAGELIWLKTYLNQGGVNQNSYLSIASLVIDDSDNIICSGLIIDSVDMDFGSNQDISTSESGEDIFFQKISKDGEHIWHKRIGGDSTKSEFVVDLEIDSMNNLYCIGDYHGVDFDCDPGTGFAFIEDANERDIFILKLDNDGNYSWGKKIGGDYYD